MSAGIVGFTPFAGASSIAGSVGASLAASGLFAICKPGRFRAGKEHQEQLANHDIVRILRAAWGQAAVATVRSYAEAFENSTPSFLEAVGKIKAEDFVPEQITVATIRQAIGMSRRFLLLEDSGAPVEAEIASQAAKLQASLVTSFLGTVRKQAQPMPESFQEWAEGTNSRSCGGILGQLCSHVAAAMKQDSRAQVAILQLSLQDLTDNVARIERGQAQILASCQKILASVDQTQQARLKEFSESIEKAVAGIESKIESAFRSYDRPPLDPPFATGASNEHRFDFTYRRRRTPLVGRDAAMSALVEFLSDPVRTGSWTVISGPAGTGKSRLAAELIAMAGGWRAGFLRKDSSWLQGAGERWQSEKDTLIVIDYAGDMNPKVLSGFLASLNRDRGVAAPVGCASRVVLIDRLPPDNDLGLASRLTSEAGDYASELLANRWVTAQRVSGIPGDQTARRDLLHLEPVDDLSALAIAEAWARPKWTVHSAERVRQAIAKDPELGRPLFAALLGDAISADGLPEGELNPVMVARTALSRLHRKAVGVQESHWKQAQHLFAIATAGQGVAECDLIESLGLDDEDAAGILGVLRRIALPDSENRILALQPDFLGELFVLDDLFTSATHKGALERVDRLMALAWGKGRKPNEFLMRLAGDFVGRANQVSAAANRSGYQPKPEAVIEILIRIFCSAATPVALDRGGTAVQAEAIRVASQGGELGIADVLMKEVERVYGSPGAGLPVFDLAVALFGYAFAPERGKSAVGRLRDLSASGLAEVRHVFSAALANRAHYLASAQQLGESSKLVDELRRLHCDFKEKAVREPLAMALYNLSLSLGNAQQLEESGKLVDELRRLHDDFKERAVREPLAAALYNRSNHLANASELDESGKLVDELRRLHDDFKEKGVREQLAKALVNHSSHLADAQQLEESCKLIDELRRLHGDFKEQAVREVLAAALFNNSNHLANASQLDESGKLVYEVRRLYNDFKEQAVRELLAKALVNLSNRLAKVQQLGESGKLVDELRRLHDDFKEQAVREQLAMALANRSNDLAKAQQLEESGKLVDELRQLNDEFKEQAVSQQLVKALTLVAILRYAFRPEELDRALAHIQEVRDLWVAFPEEAVCKALSLGLRTMSELLAEQSCEDLSKQLAEEADRLPC